MARTLVVTNDFPPKQGGIENFVYQLVRRLPADQVVVFTSSADGAADFDAQLAFPVVRARTRVLLPTPHIARGAALLARRFGCDSVYFGAAASLGLMAPYLRDNSPAKQFIGSTHSHECFWTRMPALRQTLRTLANGLDHLTFISNYAEGVIGAAVAPDVRRRMVRLSPGVDPAQFAPEAFAQVADAAPPPGQPTPGGPGSSPAGRVDDPADGRDGPAWGSGPQIISVSRLVPHKGQDTLIKALPAVRAAVPDARLTIVGGGSNSARLAGLIQTLGLQDAARLVGPVPNADIAPYYAAASVFALPTRDRTAGLQVEGLPLVCLEAAAAGLPLVVGNSGGAPETVKPGQTGLVVDSLDQGSVASALIELLADRPRAAAMGEAGRAWMAAEWTWDQRAALLQSLLTA